MANHDLRYLSIHMGKVCRHRGGSFPDQLAYIARTIVTNPRTGVESNYQTEGPVETSGIMGWNGNRDELMASAVFAEKRKKAVEGRHLILAIPNEFDRAERLESVTEMAGYLVTNYGVAVAFAVHPPADEGDQRNWHAHLLFTSRRVESGKRSLGKKTRELDCLKTGGRHVESLRGWWCGMLNDRLLATGQDTKIEHRSYERLGIKGEPTRHKGERRVAIERARQNNPHPTPVGSGQKLRPLPIPATISTEVATPQCTTETAAEVIYSETGRPQPKPRQEKPKVDWGMHSDERPSRLLPLPKPTSPQPTPTPHSNPAAGFGMGS